MKGFRNPPAFLPSPLLRAGQESRRGESISPVNCFALPSPFRFLLRDFPQNTFELCLTNTANFGNSFLKQKWGRAKGATLMHSPHKILILQGFATLRVAPRLPIQKQYE